MKYRYNIAISLALVFLMLLAPSFGFVAASPNDQGSHNSYFVGTVYNGSLIRVGMNDYGAIGINDPTLGPVGFQYPIGADNESLAYGWYGEGYAIYYASSSAGFSPDDDKWGTLTGVTPTILVDSAPFGQIQTCTMVTNDGKIQLTFKLLFFTDEKFCIIQSYIKNLGSNPVDLEFKRVCDWDVWFSSGNDYWGKDDVRHPELNMAVAFKNTTVARGTVYMGFATCVAPSNWTLAWDDFGEGLPSRGMDVGFYQSYLTASGISIDDYWDGCAVYQWLGTLGPSETVMIPTIYAAGDTLVELEANAAVAQLWQNYVLEKPVGGSLVPVDKMAVLSPYLALLALIAAASVAVVFAIKRRPFY
jgi:hypothetical protein